MTIAQQAQDCTFTVSPENLSLPAAGGTGRVAVATGASCVWSAASNTPWIQLTSAPSSTGSGETTFQVADTSGGARTGTLTIAGRTVTVSQGAGCSYGLSATGQTVPGEGGSGTVAVATAGDCPWTASS